MEFDVMMFVLCRHFTDDNKIRENGEVSEWFTNLTDFAI
jgi:hypothetical protein